MKFSCEFSYVKHIGIFNVSDILYNIYVMINWTFVSHLQKARRLLTWSWLRDWCVDWWHSGRDDEYDEEDDQTPSDVPGGISYGTTVSRSTSLNVIHQQPTTPPPIKSYHAVNNNRLTNRSLSNDSVSARRCVYIILIYNIP